MTLLTMVDCELPGGMLMDENWHTVPGPDVIACLAEAMTTGSAFAESALELTLQWFDLSPESTLQSLGAGTHQSCHYFEIFLCSQKYFSGLDGKVRRWRR